MKYEVTLTIKPLWYQFPPEEQFRLALRYLEDILKPYEVSMVAELSGENNVHFHGLIELRDHLERNTFLNKFRGSRSKFFGKKTCNQVMFENSYILYMRKDLEKTRLIVRDPIIRDSFGVFKMLFSADGPE